MKRLLRLAPLSLAVFLAGCPESNAPAGPGQVAITSRAMVAVTGLTATYTPAAAGQFSHRVSFTLREAGGLGVTVTGLTVTLTNNSGVNTTSSPDLAATFASTRLALNGTLASNVITLSNSPSQGTQLTVQVRFTDDQRVDGSAQASVTPAAGGTPPALLR